MEAYYSEKSVKLLSSITHMRNIQNSVYYIKCCTRKRWTENVWCCLLFEDSLQCSYCWKYWTDHNALEDLFDTCLKERSESINQSDSIEEWRILILFRKRIEVCPVQKQWIVTSQDNQYFVLNYIVYVLSRFLADVQLHIFKSAYTT